MYFSDTNPCIDGTHTCTPYENCVTTLAGFECHARSILPLPMSIQPENLTKYKKKQNCDIGYTYSVYEQKCKGDYDYKLLFVNKYTYHIEQMMVSEY